MDTHTLTFQLESFEGPLNLLLHLIQKHKIDIYNIPIAQITQQYLAYIERMQELNLDIAGEFLVMAATLMNIKSRLMLPVLSSEESGDEEDLTLEELVIRLLEYQKFKEVSLILEDRAEAFRECYTHPVAGLYPTGTEVEIRATLFDLLRAFQKLMQDTETIELSREVQLPPVSIDDRIEFLLQRLPKTGEPVAFRDMFRPSEGRIHVIVTFLALLELLRQNRLTAYQTDTLGTIWLSQTSS
ncbi:MAG: segregation/condensation protein A [Gemmatimonadetes bacterium]|nr:MAG: segregation/condensation protein A [Gemmatimonadota bacterium]